MLIEHEIISNMPLEELNSILNDVRQVKSIAYEKIEELTKNFTI